MALPSAVVPTSSAVTAAVVPALGAAPWPALSLAMYQLKFWVAGWPMFKEVGCKLWLSSRPVTSVSSSSLVRML